MLIVKLCRVKLFKQKTSMSQMLLPIKKTDRKPYEQRHVLMDQRARNTQDFDLFLSNNKFKGNDVKFVHSKINTLFINLLLN